MKKATNHYITKKSSKKTIITNIYQYNNFTLNEEKIQTTVNGKVKETTESQVFIPLNQKASKLFPGSYQPQLMRFKYTPPSKFNPIEEFDKCVKSIKKTNPTIIENETFSYFKEWHSLAEKMQDIMYPNKVTSSSFINPENFNKFENCFCYYVDIDSHIYCLANPYPLPHIAKSQFYTNLNQDSKELKELVKQIKKNKDVIEVRTKVETEIISEAIVCLTVYVRATNTFLKNLFETSKSKKPLIFEFSKEGIEKGLDIFNIKKFINYISFSTEF